MVIIIIVVTPSIKILLLSYRIKIYCVIIFLNNNYHSIYIWYIKKCSIQTYKRSTIEITVFAWTHEIGFNTFSDQMPNRIATEAINIIFEEINIKWKEKITFDLISKMVENVKSTITISQRIQWKI